MGVCSRLSCMQGGNRIKLVRNKKVAEMGATERSVSDFLDDGKDEMAMMRVEQVIRLENYLKAIEIVEIFLEMVRTRVDQIARQKDMPDDMLTSIFSLAFASHRMTDIPELRDLRKHFEMKYGSKVMQQVAGVDPEVACRVSAQLVAYLGVEPPDFETKLKKARDISLRLRKEDLDDASLREAAGEYSILAPPGSPMACTSRSNQIVDIPVPTGAQHVSDFDAEPNYMSEFVDRAYDAQTNLPPPQGPPAAAHTPASDASDVYWGCESSVGEPYSATVPESRVGRGSYTDAMAFAQAGIQGPNGPYMDSTNSEHEFYPGSHVPTMNVGVDGAFPIPLPAGDGQESWYPDSRQADFALPSVPESNPEEGEALEVNDFPKAPNHDPCMPSVPRHSHTGVVFQPMDQTPSQTDATSDPSVQEDLLERLKRLQQ